MSDTDAYSYQYTCGYAYNFFSEGIGDIMIISWGNGGSFILTVITIALYYPIFARIFM